MVSKVQPTAGQQTYCEQITNWKNKESSTLWKVAKFVLAFFAYIPAFIVDMSVKAGKLLFGEKEETVELTRWEKFKQKFFDVKDSFKEFHSNHKKVIWTTAGAVTTAVAGYYTWKFGVVGKGVDLYRSYAPTWLLGYAKKTAKPGPEQSEATPNGAKQPNATTTGWF